MKRYQKMKQEQKQAVFVKRVDEEYEAFRKEMLGEGTEAVYENCSRIYFFREMWNFLTGEDYLEDLEEGLFQLPYPIEALWEYYLRRDGYTVGSEAGLFELTGDFCREKGLVV